MDSSFDRLHKALAKLPGLGRRSAERAALALVRRHDGLLEELLEALAQARTDIRLCPQCGGIASASRDFHPHEPSLRDGGKFSSSLCRICTDPARDATLLCVVEDPSDILAMERSGAFHGHYHALLGKLSAARATGPSDLRLRELAHRVASGAITEVVLAISTDMEGDATAAYITELLHNTPATVTRLAFGLPADSGIGYSDPVTLRRALAGRQHLA